MAFSGHLEIYHISRFHRLTQIVLPFVCLFQLLYIEF